MVGESKAWAYYGQFTSAGKAVERILWHVGWLPAVSGDTFVVSVRAEEDIPVPFGGD